MSLPNPLPDNPSRWEGWRNYNSDDYYARLCLSFDSNPSPEQIEDNCRQLLVWWQKKLPLKSQPSNPVAQMLRDGLDEAPRCLAEARTVLLDGVARAELDHELHKRAMASALEEFKKLLSFAIGSNQLREEDEQRLYERGRGLGLPRDDMKAAVDAELARFGAERVATPVAPVASAAPARPSPAPVPNFASMGDGKDPSSEFRRILAMSRLCLDGEEMTDDQRDAMCNVGESLGLTGGQAEDLIDEYLEQASGMPMPAPAAAPPRQPAIAVAAPKAAPVSRQAPAPASRPAAPKPVLAVPSPLGRSQERLSYPNFRNTAGMEMLLITSGVYVMGSSSRDAQSNEQPLTKVTVSCFYMARFPVTNAQYEAFDPGHKAKRAPWADGNHPVVYVNSREAERYCLWLSGREGKKYRLPTEAEWEYAARGIDGRTFPWGERFDAGHFANFADLRTTFAWREPTIDDGFAETAPIGSHPKGASPFGIEELAGNVFEWCLDCFEPYRGKERSNPRGPTQGPKRLYRGGSWKSRVGSLRTTARASNLPDYLSNDVGFRVICECEPA